MIRMVLAVMICVAAAGCGKRNAPVPDADPAPVVVAVAAAKPEPAEPAAADPAPVVVAVAAAKPEPAEPAARANAAEPFTRLVPPAEPAGRELPVFPDLDRTPTPVPPPTPVERRPAPAGSPAGGKLEAGFVPQPQPQQPPAPPVAMTNPGNAVVTEQDMKDIHLLVDTASLASGRMPSPVWVLAALKLIATVRRSWRRPIADGDIVPDRQATTSRKPLGRIRPKMLRPGSAGSAWSGRAGPIQLIDRRRNQADGGQPLVGFGPQHQ